MDREAKWRYFTAVLFKTHVAWIGRKQRAHGSNRQIDGIARVGAVAPSSCMKDQSLLSPKG
jgi:hypothetical protein